MIAKLLYKLSCRLPFRAIDIEGQPYLERYALGQLFGSTFYLHRFISSDDERKVHNHPWSHSLAIVLTGGYIEERMQYLDVKLGPVCRLINRHVWRISIINGAAFHRILNPQPETWTLFIHSTHRRQAWGFLELIDGGIPERNVTIFNQHLETENHDWEKEAAPARLSCFRMPFNRGQ